ncbi:MAG: hypothetical protein ACI4JM_06595 [Oscillospiraceae bacterium]
MEKICRYAEEILSDMIFCGLENVSAEMIEKLEILADNMNELGMAKGRDIVKDICKELSEFRRKENDGENLRKLISKMEFYLTVIDENSVK